MSYRVRVQAVRTREATSGQQAQRKPSWSLEGALSPRHAAATRARVSGTHLQSTVANAIARGSAAPGSTRVSGICAARSWGDWQAHTAHTAAHSSRSPPASGITQAEASSGRSVSGHASPAAPAAPLAVNANQARRAAHDRAGDREGEGDPPRSEAATKGVQERTSAELQVAFEKRSAMALKAQHATHAIETSAREVFLRRAAAAAHAERAKIALQKAQRIAAATERSGAAPAAASRESRMLDQQLDKLSARSMALPARTRPEPLSVQTALLDPSASGAEAWAARKEWAAAAEAARTARRARRAHLLQDINTARARLSDQQEARLAMNKLADTIGKLQSAHEAGAQVRGNAAPAATAAADASVAEPAARASSEERATLRAGSGGGEGGPTPFGGAAQSRSTPEAAAESETRSTGGAESNGASTDPAVDAGDDGWDGQSIAELQQQVRRNCLCHVAALHAECSKGALLRY